MSTYSRAHIFFSISGGTEDQPGTEASGSARMLGSTDVSGRGVEKGMASSTPLMECIVVPGAVTLPDMTGVKAMDARPGSIVDNPARVSLH